MTKPIRVINYKKDHCTCTTPLNQSLAQGPNSVFMADALPTRLPYLLVSSVKVSATQGDLCVIYCCNETLVHLNLVYIETE